MCLSKAKGDLTLSTSSLAGQIKVVREVWREKPTPLDTISEERAVPGGLCVDWTCLYLWIQTWTWSRTQWTKQGLGKRRSQSASTGTLLHFCVWMVIVIYECVCVYVVCVHVYTLFKCGLEQPANILSTIYHASAKSEVSCNDCNISARPQVLVFIIECFNVFFWQKYRVTIYKKNSMSVIETGIFFLLLLSLGLVIVDKAVRVIYCYQL